MTSSVIAFVGLAGYGAYSPAKSAMRSLADSLRQEMALYNGNRRRKGASSSTSSAASTAADVKIHCVFPATITTPGFEEEEKTKHAVTKILEEGDPRQTAEEVATASIKGLERGDYMVTTNILGRAMRVSAMGGAPRNNMFVDTLFSWATSIAWLFIGPDMDGKVYDWGKTNEVRLPSA